jgi:hypothetical protein
MATNAPNLVELQKLRLSMNRALQDLNKQTTALDKALRSHGDASLSGGLQKLRQALKAADTRLVDSLDKALNESDPGKRTALYATAGRTAREFLKLIDGDPAVKQLETNPLSPVPARAAVAKVLTALTRLLP